jgi:hypothetical protein
MLMAMRGCKTCLPGEVSRITVQVRVNGRFGLEDPADETLASYSFLLCLDMLLLELVGWIGMTRVVGMVAVKRN